MVGKPRAGLQQQKPVTLGLSYAQSDAAAAFDWYRIEFRDIRIREL